MTNEQQPAEEANESRVVEPCEAVPWQARYDLCLLRQGNQLVAEMVVFVTNVGPRTGVALEQYATLDDDLFSPAVTGARDRALIAAYDAIALAGRSAFATRDSTGPVPPQRS